MIEKYMELVFEYKELDETILDDKYNNSAV